MHGTSGQYRLDMKRDDPRTLMLKMDARLTFAGRERNVALQLEGEREMKHIEWRRQLSQTEFKRQERDVRRRMEFFQSLIEENKQLRRTSMTDVNLFETEIETTKATSKRRWSRLPQLPMPVRRKMAHLDRAENVGSVRRDQQAFSHNRARERFLNRSLNELSNCYKKHQSQKEINEAKLMKISAEMATIGRPKVIPEEPTQPSHDGLPKLHVSIREPQHAKSRRQTQPQTVSLPELPNIQETRLPQRERRISISQRLSSDDLNKLPGITVTEDKVSRSGVRRISLARNFYMDTSHSQTAGNRRRDSIQLITLNNPKLKSDKRKADKVPSLRLPAANALPSHFYDGIYEENPFLTPDFKPEASRELVETTKSNEMYAWLGLDSAEELASLRGGDVIGVGKDGTDEMEWLEIESTSDVQSNPDIPTDPVEEDNPPRNESRKRIYRIGGSVDLGQAKDKVNPLKKFASAAKTIMIVRKMQDEAGIIPETDEPNADESV